jgi:superfamily II DNA helicase RecQ
MLVSVQKHSIKATYAQNLFVKNGKCMSSADISNAFTYSISFALSKTFAFSSFRQWAKYICNVFAIGDEAQFLSKPNCRQFGHGEAVSSVYYGRASDESDLVRSVDLAGYLRISLEYEDLLGKLISDPLIGFPIPCDGDQMIDRWAEADEPTKIDTPAPLKVLSGATSQAALNLIRDLYHDPRALFKSSHQRAAVETVLSSCDHLLLALSTGGGKSLTFFAYARSFPDRLTVVIVPTISLRSDIILRANALGISASCDISAAEDVALLLVTPELAKLTGFDFVITRAHALGRLGRIFIDECHCIFTESSYRPDFLLLPYLRRFEVPVCLLSATLTTIQMKTLSSMFMLDKNVVIIRGPSNRPNHKYRVLTYQALPSICKTVNDIISKFAERDRAIIYVREKWLANRISTMLLAPTFQYHSDIEEGARAIQAARWTMTSKAVMLATKGFGLGIDSPYIKAVFVIDLIDSVHQVAQMFGRAGRAGEIADCIMFYSRQEEITFSRKHYPTQEYRDLVYFVSEGVCRRRVLSKLFDGFEVGCESYEGCQLCDTCSNGTLFQEHTTQALSPVAIERRLTVAASRLFARQELMGRRIVEVLEFLKVNCCTCLIFTGMTRDKNHPGECERRDRCLRCFATDHRVERCQVKLLKGENKQDGLCGFCYMPESLGSVTFHRDAMTALGCGWRDVLLELCMSAFGKGLPICADHQTAQQWYDWLMKSSSRVPFLNIHVAALAIVETELWK